MEWIHIVLLLMHSLCFRMLRLFAFLAVRERFACKETLNEHQRSLRLVAGDLMAGSSHGCQAEAALRLALVLHNVATHLSSSLGSKDHHKKKIFTKTPKRFSEIIIGVFPCPFFMN